MNLNKKVIKEIKSFIFTIVLAFSIGLFINTEVLAVAKVEQSSMENTLFNGNRLLIDKLSYNFFEVKRGDIIIFFENEERSNIIDNIKNTISSILGENDNISLVKRVIGVPGDEINIKDGFVYLNGEKIDETYVKGETISRDISFPIKVSENKLLVLGDNRGVSKDSRNFGLIDNKQVEGKAIFRVYPFNKIETIK
ncbi:signal peptidase I [Clostridium carnis]